MSEMVDRVARAMLDSVIASIEKELPPERLKPGSDMTFDHPRTREAYRGHARAAIAAMREPTQEMAEIGADAYANGNPEDYVSVGGIRNAWREIIDAMVASPSSTSK